MAEEKDIVEKVHVKPEDVIDVQGSNYKKPMSRKFADIFISDQADTVGSFIVQEVIIPSVKDAILDILHGTVDRVFGNSAYGGYNSRRRQDFEQEASYRKYHDRGRGRSDVYYDDRDDNEYRRHRSSFDESIFNLNTSDKVKKNRVMERMTDLMHDQRYISIYDMKSLLHFPPKDIDPSDNDWGWDDLRYMRSYRDFKGNYVIELPRPDDIVDLKREYRERRR